MPAQQSKYWCFTINNYTDDDVVCLDCCQEDSRVTYVVYGYERGDAGTPHLQGYIEFRKKQRITAVKKFVGRRAHLELRRGTALEASDYCKKDGDYVEFGNISTPEPGKRSDLDAIKESITGGATELEIANAHFSQWVVYRRSFIAYRSLIKPAMCRPELKVYVLYGPPGHGKSSYVHSRHPEVYSVPAPDLRWFNGYDGEVTVLVDDFEGTADVGFFKKFLDIYKMQVPTKGGFVNFHATRIYITTNTPVPWQYYADEAAIKRRITKTILVERQEGESLEEIHTRIDNEINS